MLSERVNSIENKIAIVNDFMKQYKLNLNSLEKFKNQVQDSEGCFDPFFHGESIMIDKSYCRAAKLSDSSPEFIIINE